MSTGLRTTLNWLKRLRLLMAATYAMVGFAIGTIIANSIGGHWRENFLPLLALLLVAVIRQMTDAVERLVDTHYKLATVNLRTAEAMLDQLNAAMAQNHTVTEIGGILHRMPGKPS